MSLRGFHIFFISLVTLASMVYAAMLLLMGYAPLFGWSCAAFGVAAACYGTWFIRKSRKLIL